MPVTTSISGGHTESVELQVDYWLSGSSAVAAAAAAVAAPAAISLATMAQAVKREKSTASDQQQPPPSSVKYTVKAGFRWIVVQRLPAAAAVVASSPSVSSSDASLFTMTFGLKEKKQKSKRNSKTFFYVLIFLKDLLLLI